MIKKLNILNFQSHKDTQLEFSPGVNVIVGATDSGKTAIIRALRWLIWNRPMGEAFRSRWGGPTAVTLLTTDDQVITRGKTDSSNVYKIDITTLKAVKHDVPEQVQKVLNIDATNLQQQLDAPFLISNSPGEVATFFNRVARLDQIDSGTKNIQGQIRTLTSTIKSDESRLQNLELEVGQYQYLDRAEIDLAILETDEKKQNQRRGAFTTLATLINEMRVAFTDIATVEEITDLEVDVEEVLTMHANRNATENTLNSLLFDIGEYQTLEEMITEHGITQKFEDLIDPILKMMQTKFGLLERVDSAKIVLNEIRDSDSMMNEIRQELVDMENTFHIFMPKECPLCGSVIKTKK